MNRLRKHVWSLLTEVMVSWDTREVRLKEMSSGWSFRWNMITAWYILLVLFCHLWTLSLFRNFCLCQTDIWAGDKCFQCFLSLYGMCYFYNERIKQTRIIAEMCFTQTSTILTVFVYNHTLQLRHWLRLLLRLLLRLWLRPLFRPVWSPVPKLLVFKTTAGAEAGVQPKLGLVKPVSL